jgi:hypothetical protein
MIKKVGKKSRLQFLTLKIFPFTISVGELSAVALLQTACLFFIGVCGLIAAHFGSQFARAKAFILKPRN